MYVSEIKFANFKFRARKMCLSFCFYFPQMAEESLASDVAEKILLMNNSLLTNTSSTRSPDDVPQTPNGTSSIFKQCFYPQSHMYEHNLPVTIIFTLFIIIGAVYSLFGE